jgi:predicted nuclease of predicted toxin-antitoxin system
VPAVRRIQTYGGSPNRHDCVLVTKDEDFHRLSILRGAPPKAIWVRLGNCSTIDIAKLIREHARESSRNLHESNLRVVGQFARPFTLTVNM